MPSLATKPLDMIDATYAQDFNKIRQKHKFVDSLRKREVLALVKSVYVKFSGKG